MSVLGITYSDFGKGRFELHHGIYSQVTLQNYIDRYELVYLAKLLGVKEFEKFKADLVGGVPQSAIWVKVFEPFQEDYQDCDVIISEGMIDMIKGFIYFMYVKDLTNQMTPNGSVRQLGENSENISTLNNMMYSRYNESVRTYRAIQAYICDNQRDYLDYNGQRLAFNYWI
jgi:hypothetical protein